MVFIIGGAYQGKLDYAKAAFSIADNEVFTCDSAKIDFSRRCIYCIEKFTLACVRETIDPTEYFRSRREKWKDSIDVELGYFPPTKDLFGLLIFSSGKSVYLEKVLFGDGLATISIPTVASQVDIYFIKRLSILDATDLSWEELQQSELVYKHDRVILDMDREPAKIDCSPYGDLEVWYWKGKKAQ